METTLQLISTPWASPNSPSIQLGGLKAYVDQELGGQIVTTCHSLFRAVVLRLGRELGEPTDDLFERFSSFQEYLYFLLAVRRGDVAHGLGSRGVEGEAIAALCRSPHTTGGLDERGLSLLEEVTIGCMEELVVPRLRRAAVNLVGFTVNFNQLYASLYCAQYLRDRCPQFPVLFLFGGSGACTPQGAALLGTLGAPGLGVVGEGERQLTAVVQGCLDHRGGQLDGIVSGLASSYRGLYDIGAAASQLHGHLPGDHALQLPCMDDLPLPDYHEFFSLVDPAGDQPADAPRRGLSLAMEGSRGCSARCDFCGDNFVWGGYRAHRPGRVVDRVLALAREHGLQSSHFVDNLCDGWAEEYADILLQRGLVHETRMEMRVDHPEQFWTKLALAGVWGIQIGVEALSTSLLRRMHKGTTATQNIMAHKYLAELGVRSRGNLITHHPRSTVSDVEETRRILVLLPHLAPLRLSEFNFAFGSPLYEQLSIDEQMGLEPWDWVELPAPLREQYISPYLSTPPGTRLPAETRRAWDALSGWYEQHLDQNTPGATTLQVTRPEPGRLCISGTRHGHQEETLVEGLSADLYDACHGARSESELVQSTGARPVEVRRILDGFVARRLMLAVDGRFLSLATRPRGELVAAVDDGLGLGQVGADTPATGR